MDDIFDSREFYEVCQQYRWAKETSQVNVIKAFDALKDFCRASLSQAEGGEARLSDALIEHEAGVYGHYDSNLDQWEFIGSSVLDFGRSIADQAHSAPVQEAEKGWKLVPIEPTKAMIDAGYMHTMRADEEEPYRARGEAIACYSDMIAASPTQEAVSERTAEPTDDDIRAGVKAFQSGHNGFDDLSDWKVFYRVVSSRLAAPATEPTADKRKMIYNAWAMLKAEDNDGAYRVLSELIGWNPDTAKPIAAPATEPTEPTDEQIKAAIIEYRLRKGSAMNTDDFVKALRSVLAAPADFKSADFDCVDQARRAASAKFDHYHEVMAATEPKARCPSCDGTGDLHSLDGEWLGRCHCVAASAKPAGEPLGYLYEPKPGSHQIKPFINRPAERLAADYCEDMRYTETPLYAALSSQGKKEGQC